MSGHLVGRERGRLERARENGYLNARCPENRRIVKAFGLWCWRLKIPMVWFERRSPRSRYARVHLDLLTTAQMLTVAGQAEMKALGARASPHDACWDHVPMRDLDRLANQVFRAATRSGNYEPNRAKLIDIQSQRPKKLFPVPSRVASA
jgi:hypothetical protein